MSKLELYLSITIAFKYLEIDMVRIAVNQKEDRPKIFLPKPCESDLCAWVTFEMG